MSVINFCHEFTNLKHCKPHAVLFLQDCIPTQIHPTIKCGFMDTGTLVTMYIDSPGCVMEGGDGCNIVWVNPMCECDKHTLHQLSGESLTCRHDFVVGTTNDGGVCYVKVRHPCRRLVFVE